MIDITGVDLIEFIKKTYELSTPQGLGFFHFEEGGLSDKEAKTFINRKPSYGSCIISMDYVRGRACKMTVFEEDGKITIRDQWYDHTNEQLEKLLSHFNITTEEKEHSGSCNCDDCRKERGNPKQKIIDFLDMTGIKLDPKKSN